MISLPKQEYLDLRKKVELDEELLISLVRGLEDIRAGRVKPFKELNS